MQAFARLIGPGAARSVAQIQRPLFVSCAAFAALFVREREIEMDVRVRGHRARGPAKMINGFVEFAEFLQRAAQVISRDAVQRINLHGGEERIARVG